MGLVEQLQGNANYGIPNKKSRMKSNTPMKLYLRSMFEESVRRQMMNSMQAPQLGQASSPMIEPPSVSPLENMLISNQQGGTTNPPGGVPYGS